MRPINVSVSSIRLAVVALTAVALLSVAPATAFAQAQFWAVGDLPGGSFHSQIRDAARVGNTILAVGSSSVNTQGCPSNCFGAADTAILWKWDGTSASLTALPNLVVNTGATTPIIASAITPDGAYIASRGRSHPINGQRQAVRVSTALVPFPSANLNLANQFSPALAPNTFANSISSDGSILYGQSGSEGIVVRFDATGSSSLRVPLLPGAPNASPTAKGTSADGSVVVGWSGAFGPANPNNPVSGRAFRYVFGSGTSEIPTLAGGSWNGSVALSADGNLVLVAGDSTSYPNGEVYLYNATTGGTTPLGSPNYPWSPSSIAGMTADGSVVAVQFGGQSRGFGYFHNSHGWFLLSSALIANGINLKAQGWTELGVLGISADGTLVFGQGVHNEQYEGYVAEFPAGYLASFNAPAVPVTDTSIVGAWSVSDVESGSPATAVFMKDGTYYILQGSVQPTEINAAPGFERGVYSWNATTGTLITTTLNSTIGDAGLADSSGDDRGVVTVVGDTLTVTLPGGDVSVATRLNAPVGVPLKNTLVGAWVIGDAAARDSSAVVVFDGNGNYLVAQDGSAAEIGGHDGIEVGTYAWDPTGQNLTPTGITLDSNGDWGLSDSIGPVRMQPFIDGLTAQAGDDTGLMTATRVIDPNRVIPAITSATTASGTWGSAFSFTVTATNGAYEFTATGLPAGLSIDGSTGVISGTPSASGTFAVSLSAANSVRSGLGTLTISVANKIVLTGFYAPVNSAPGFLNVAEGGSTVPLKFDISVNGVEKTDTAGIVFSLGSTSCTPGGPETPVPVATTGGSSLRYTGQMFIQNWKTPKTSGCFVVRVTLAPGGQTLTAAFRLMTAHDRGDHRECDHDKGRDKGRDNDRENDKDGGRGDDKGKDKDRD